MEAARKRAQANEEEEEESALKRSSEKELTRICGKTEIDEELTKGHRNIKSTPCRRWRRTVSRRAALLSPSVWSRAPSNAPAAGSGCRSRAPQHLLDEKKIKIENNFTTNQ